MSYCRNNGKDSDVYVVASFSDTEKKEIWACYCNLSPFIAYSRQGMITHLKEHELKGDKVPQRAFDRLRREITENA
jgi:hypothetical protein